MATHYSVINHLSLQFISNFIDCLETCPDVWVQVKELKNKRCSKVSVGMWGKKEWKVIGTMTRRWAKFCQLEGELMKGEKSSEPEVFPIATVQLRD